jgi:1L-myo-inositol 1-phosphate cytidylyltransferase
VRLGPRNGKKDDLEVTVTAGPFVPVRDALILAAGNGDRFHDGSRQSKLLQPILGEPIILRTLTSVRAAGISQVEVVLGYQAVRLRSLIEANALPGLQLHFSYNPDWHLENGVSVLAARHRLADRRFSLLMGDHLFEPPVLARLLVEPAEPGESLLAIDSRSVHRDVAAEATKVRRAGDRIVAIGKNLTHYDALDTGMFVCSPSIFEALDRSRADGDTTLSGGIRQLAAEGLMRGVDIGQADWYDIDTMADLEYAESLLGGRAETA